MPCGFGWLKEVGATYGVLTSIAFILLHTLAQMREGVEKAVEEGLTRCAGFGSQKLFDQG